jgi:hypothetical protein
VVLQCTWTPWGHTCWQSSICQGQAPDLCHPKQCQHLARMLGTTHQHHRAAQASGGLMQGAQQYNFRHQRTRPAACADVQAVPPQR